MIYYISRIKDKSHTIISIDAENVFEKKIQQFFIIKMINKLGIEGNILNTIKGIYEKFQLKSYLLAEQWMISLGSRARQMFTLTVSAHHCTEGSSQSQ